MVAAAFVLLMVNGCGPGSDPKLEALKDDPMARYAPAEGQLRDTRTGTEHTTLGKPVAAEYVRLFSLPQGDPESQLQAVVDAATDVGWTVNGDPVFRFEDTLTKAATKRLSTGQARLSVTVFTNGTPSGVPGVVLMIHLEHS